MSSTPIVKFLIIRFSSIGDIVLTTPVVRCLKQQVEGVEIHYLIKKRFSTLVKNNPYIDKVHEFEGELSKTISNLKKENYHYIIDLHRSLRSKIVKSRLKVLSFSFNKLNFHKWLIVNFKINILPNIHIVDRYLKTVSIFDVNNDNKGLDYFIPEEDEVKLQSLPIKIENKYIAFSISANHNTKQLPADKIISICEKLPFPVVLLGGEDNNELGSIIQKSVGQNVYNACGKYNLNQSASLIKQSDMVITHDTGLMHIAAALKKKIISVWGNTIPEFGMQPYLPGDDSKIVEVNNLKCRPCSKIGHNRCPKKHFKCMKEINEKTILDLIMN
ncbi:glycosyltransferase family 9 protein [Bacteroidota bacterium]